MRKLLSILLAALFLMLLFSAPSVKASYRLSLTGAVDFMGEPWNAENFTGYVIVGLGAEAQSELEVTLSVSGDIAPWLTWNGGTTFTLYPSQKRTVGFTLVFPSSAPDEYTGQITANGVPPSEEVSGGATVVGNVAVAIGTSINVPARVFFQALSADGNGASSTVINGRTTAFTGNVSYNLSQGGSWIETHVRNITSLNASQTDQTSVNWNLVPQLGVVYDVVFTLTEFDGTLIDEKVKQFRLPTPADIESVFHRPSVVYADYDATIVATVHEPQNGQTECTAHYIIDGGTEQTGPMVYDSGSGEYLLLIDNTSYTEGSLVEYWVTSFNDASGVEYTDTSVHKTFQVYSNTAPDLVIDESSLLFIPLDPTNETMYDTNTTNAFVTIRNSGRGDASYVVLEMFDYNVSLDRQSISLIASDNSDIVRFNLQLAAGDHVLMFIVDPDDDIVEINEHNNYFSLEFTVEQAPPPPPPPPGAENPWAIVPFILIPIVLLIVLFLFFFKRGKTVNVSVLKVREFISAQDHTTRFMYTCGYVEDEPALGVTRSTRLKAEVGEVLQVKPEGMHEKEDGDLKWEGAEVIKLLTDTEPSTEQEVRKLIKKN